MTDFSVAAGNPHATSAGQRAPLRRKGGYTLSLVRRPNGRRAGTARPVLSLSSTLIGGRGVSPALATASAGVRPERRGPTSPPPRRGR